MAQPITIWNRDGEFNHIENGFDPNRVTPTAIDDEQKKSWKNAKWTATKAWLIDGRVTEAHKVCEFA